MIDDDVAVARLVSSCAGTAIAVTAVARAKQRHEEENRAAVQPKALFFFFLVPVQFNTAQFNSVQLGSTRTSSVRNAGIHSFIRPKVELAALKPHALFDIGLLRQGKNDTTNSSSSSSSSSSSNNNKPKTTEGPKIRIYR